MRGWVRLVGFVIALAGAVVALRDAGSKERGKAAGAPARAACDLPAAPQRVFEVRGSLTAQEKCLGIAWIAGGARDAKGNLPRWRE
jgi:hypothetical protein